MSAFKCTAALRIDGQEPQLQNLECPDEDCYKQCVAAFNAVRDNTEAFLAAKGHDKMVAAGCSCKAAELLCRVVCGDGMVNHFDSSWAPAMLPQPAVDELNKQWQAFTGCQAVKKFAAKKP